jgi:CRISPR-associated protein Csd1
MLNHLIKYSKDCKLPTTPGFAAVSIRWALCLDATGTPLAVIEWPENGRKGRRFTFAPRLEPAQVAGKDAKSQFLYETVDVVALMEKDGTEVQNPRKRARHIAFVDNLKNASKSWSMLVPIAQAFGTVHAVQRMRQLLHEKGAKPTDKVTLLTGKDALLDSTQWHDWWRRHLTTLGDDETRETTTGSRVRCFATGELVHPLLTTPKITGLVDVGGHAAGDVLIGFDKEAFTSLGFQQSENAAVSATAATTYRSALNDLLDRHCKRLAGAKVVYWYDREVEEARNPIGFLDWGKDEEGDDERDELNALHKARQLLNAVQNGETRELGSSHYFMLTLSGAAGRVMVRDWAEGQFGALVSNIANWFEDMAIIHREGGRLAPSQKFISVLLALHSGLGDKVSFPDKVKRIPPPFAAKMWRVAVCGERLPDGVLAKALAQFRSDLVANVEASFWARMNHARMAIVKAYFVRKAREKGEVNHMMVGLNENHPSPAYHCGRLMAVLAGVQKEALGPVGAGIVQRYYAAASATPALVFGRLVRTSQFHLGKLDAGLANWFNSKIADIWNRLRQDPPKTLSLEEQTLFAMGYYQQMAVDRGGNVTDKGEKIETAETNKEA